MRAFAEQELILPDGPAKGRRFRVHRQPYTAPWLSLVSSGQWQRVFTTGPTQSGKSWIAFVLPILYHLFEIQETVICGLPDMGMADDKWHEDLLPAIEASRFRELLPTRGAGSRGGKLGAAQSVRFMNGVTLRFMSGGGGDKSRAAFTSRVVVITEVDGMDVAGGTSREADKITQMEARSDAYGSRRRIYGECTVTVEEGRTWQEYSKGTATKIILPCPHCTSWVTPEREHLLGWQDADNVVDAMANAHWTCPECGEPWTDDERAEANQRGKVLHRGQELDGDGNVCGELPATDTLGLRWSATNNLFWSAGDVARREWNGQRVADEDLAERELCQFVWAVPHKSLHIQATRLDIATLLKRTTNDPRGVVPAGARYLSVGIDVGKFLSHYAVIAWRDLASGLLMDYGRIDVPSREWGTEAAILRSLRDFRDTVLEPGWPIGAPAAAERMSPDRVCVDARWQGGTIGVYPVYQFTNESGDAYMPALGYGATQQNAKHYSRPTKTGRQIASIKEGYHIARQNAPRVQVVHVDSDHFKSFLHERLHTPRANPGALLFHEAAGNEHLGFIRHLCAEHPQDEFIPGRGTVTRWLQVSPQNHFLDAAMLACVAGHLAGVRLPGAAEEDTTRVDNDYFKKRTRL